MVRKFVRGGVFEGVTRRRKRGGIKKICAGGAKIGEAKKIPPKEGGTKNFGAEGAEEEEDTKIFFDFRKIYSTPSHVLSDHSLKGSHWMYQLKIFKMNNFRIALEVVMCFLLTGMMILVILIFTH